MSRLKQDIAAAQVKAALLALIDAHATDDHTPHSAIAEVNLDDGGFFEGTFTLASTVRGGVFPIAGGSL